MNTERAYSLTVQSLPRVAEKVALKKWTSSADQRSVGMSCKLVGSFIICNNNECHDYELWEENISLSIRQVGSKMSVMN
jgi:hypothetical protein